MCLHLFIFIIFIKQFPDLSNKFCSMTFIFCAIKKPIHAPNWNTDRNVPIFLHMQITFISGKLEFYSGLQVEIEVTAGNLLSNSMYSYAVYEVDFAYQIVHSNYIMAGQSADANRINCIYYMQ